MRISKKVPDHFLNIPLSIYKLSLPYAVIYKIQTAPVTDPTSVLCTIPMKVSFGYSNQLTNRFPCGNSIQ